MKIATKRIISLIISAAMLLSFVLVAASCGANRELVTFDGGAVTSSEVEALIEALAELKNYKKGGEDWNKYYDAYTQDLLFAKLYELEHEDVKFAYSEEIYESYLDALEKQTLEQNMGLRKYADSLGQSLSYLKASIRIQLYNSALDKLEEAAEKFIKDDEDLKVQYIRHIYDSDPSKYTVEPGCSGYAIIIDSRGDSEEEKKAVYDETMDYIRRLDDGENFSDLVREVQTKYPDGRLSIFTGGLLVNDVKYSADYSSYSGSRRTIYEMLKTMDEGEYTKTPLEMISNDKTETNEAGETVTVPGDYYGYAIIMAKDVLKTARQATFEEARRSIVLSLPYTYLEDEGAFYKETLAEKYHVVYNK